MVPPIRTRPNSLVASFMLAKAIELVMEIVGTYSRQWTSMSRKKGQKDRVKPHPRMASPPTRWLKARNFSAAKFRSANWLLKNIPTIAATGKALRISEVCHGVKPIPGR